MLVVLSCLAVGSAGTEVEYEVVHEPGGSLKRYALNVTAPSGYAVKGNRHSNSGPKAKRESRGYAWVKFRDVPIPNRKEGSFVSWNP